MRWLSAVDVAVERGIGVHWGMVDVLAGKTVLIIKVGSIVAVDTGTVTTSGVGEK